MKSKSLLCILILVVLLVPGCDGKPSSNTPVSTPTAPISASSQLTPAFLAANGYVSPNLPRITSEELKQKLDNGEPVVIVDVRARVGYKLFSIAGAINVPNEPEEESIAGIKSLPKDKLIAFYCAWTDDGESALAAERALSLGFNKNNVRILWNGFSRWVELGYPANVGTPTTLKK